MAGTHGDGRRPDPEFTLKDLEAIAWAEGRRHPDLAPNGGQRWTKEDTAFAVAILDEETRSRAFRRAWDAGMQRRKARAWLAKALHNRLLDLATGMRRFKLLDDLALDNLAAGDGKPGGLQGEDPIVLAERVLTKFRQEDLAALAGRLLSDDRGGATGPRARRTREVPRRTRTRHWGRTREILRVVIQQTELTREEALDLLAALADKLTGGGSP